MKQEAMEGSVANFVQKTFDILNNTEFGKIIHWSGNGKEFTIRDIQQFEETILPKYFRHRNINSFIRQLNMYGFHKSRKEPTKNIFSHPNFVKDKQDLLQKVKRKIKLEEHTNEKLRHQDEEQPKQEHQIAETQHRLQHQPSQQSNTYISPSKSEALASVTSLPMRSNMHLQKQSPFKSLISKSYILDINPELCLRMRETTNIQNEFFMEEDENLSIDDQIQRERTAFNNRMQGISIVKTCNFLDQFEF